MKKKKVKAVYLVTVTLYRIIQSELIKKGLNEIVDDNGNLVFFNEDHQFMTKIFSYDEDISDIMDRLFIGVSLNFRENDIHFKKAFLYRFINRQINRQTIEAFKLELMSTFLMNKDYINIIYSDMDKYLTQTKTDSQNNKQTNKETNSQTNKQTNKQTNEETNDGTTTSDNREAEATLPQNNVQIDVDSTIMTSANRNSINRNKQKNLQTTMGENVGESDSLSTGESESENIGESSSESKEYRLDELFKTNGVQEQIYSIFDRKCFMQIW